MSIDPNLYDKLIRYCAYRERCEQELKEKMRTLDISNQDDYLADLKEDDLFNQQRYANSYAQGRFRLKYWGKQKIRAHLRGKAVSSQAIDQALQVINMDDYYERARQLIAHKWEGVKGKNDYERKSKVFRYMAQKGYESSIISELIDDAVKGWD